MKSPALVAGLLVISLADDPSLQEDRYIATTVAAPQLKSWLMIVQAKADDVTTLCGDE